MTSAAHRPLRLGMIGLSEGNGHPYSWSAILNGYDAAELRNCPFPAIPGYMLASPPDKRLDDQARVTRVWCQDREAARHVAAACRIEHAVEGMEDMLGEVDAVLLARDDAENHLAMAKPFLEAGLPVFVDKPLALDLRAAEALYAREKYPGQVFSCTGLRFAREFAPGSAPVRALGRIRAFSGSSPKDWDKYAVHVIEPMLNILGFPALPDRHETRRENGAVECRLAWDDGLEGIFQTTGAATGRISLALEGDNGKAELVFADTLHAFSGSLAAFLAAARDPAKGIPRAQTLQVVAILEMGR